MNTLAWRSATTALPTENNPRAVFERLFGDGGSAAQRLAQARENRSILDSVTAEMARLQNRLGSKDRTKVSDYLDAVREIERRIQSVESHDQTELPNLERPTGIRNASKSARRGLYELQRLAFHADVTGGDVHARRELNFPLLPGNRITKGTTGFSHHSGQPGADGAVFQGQRLSRPSSLPRSWNRCDPPRTAMAICWTTRCSSTAAGLQQHNLHTPNDLPLRSWARGIKGFRHVVYPSERR